MTNKKSTKRALCTSILCLLVCISMFLGTTYAWFTDSVINTGNKIQAGNLDIDLELLDKDTGKWISLSKENKPIFDYDKWEPGYVDAKILKVENEGTLALKWIAKFYSENKLSALADVIDVYVLPSETELEYPENRTLDGYTCVGNLSSFVNTLEETTCGNLEAKESAYLGLALKMRESAGNEYQGLSLGGSFDIRIFATQYTSESDSFDNQYDLYSDRNILVSQSKYLNEGADTVDFAIFYKGTKIVALSVPADAIADFSQPVVVTVDGIDPETTVSVGNNTQAYAYNIDVSNLKENLTGGQLVTVAVSAPKALAAMKVYHNGVLVDNAVYDEAAGTLTFKTSHFSPFAFTTAEYDVASLVDLRDKMQIEGALVKLTSDIEIDLTKGSSQRSDSHKVSSYYNAVNIEEKNVALDLNGHGITVFCGDKYNSNSDVGALFFVGKNGSLNIVDNAGGGFIKMRSSVYAVWAPYDDPSYVDIYSGIFIADSYAKDPIGTSTDPGSASGTMKDENSNRTLIYAGFGGNINVYGGYYLYNNTPNDVLNRNNGAFNAKDFYEGNNPLLTIHEGVMLINKEYRQNPANTSTPDGSFDDYSVKLANESEKLYQISPVTVQDAVTVDGVPYSDWYKVSRNFRYKVTFMNADGTKILDTKYIKDAGAVKVDDIDDTAVSLLDSGYVNDFGGWANTASEKKFDISADNNSDVVLYPTHTEKFTVRWLDEDGNVFHSEQTTAGNKYGSLTGPESNPTSKYDNMTFEHWEVRSVDKNGNVTYSVVSDDYKITSDTSIYPFYNYDGKLGLTSHDTNGDGRADYYTVESATGLSGEVLIPGDVNGVPVTVITDLSGEWNNDAVTSIIIEDGVEEISSNAFAMTSALKEVVVPASITKIGTNTFANTYGGSLIQKTITINYEGTWAQWNAIQKADDWERGLATGTKIICTDGTATLKATEYWVYYNYEWNFVAK